MNKLSISAVLLIHLLCFSNCGSEDHRPDDSQNGVGRLVKPDFCIPPSSAGEVIYKLAQYNKNLSSYSAEFTIAGGFKTPEDKYFNFNFSGSTKVDNNKRRYYVEIFFQNITVIKNLVIYPCVQLYVNDYEKGEDTLITDKWSMDINKYASGIKIDMKQVVQLLRGGFQFLYDRETVQVKHRSSNMSDDGYFIWELYEPSTKTKQVFTWIDDDSKDSCQVPYKLTQYVDDKPIFQIKYSEPHVEDYRSIKNGNIAGWYLYQPTYSKLNHYVSGAKIKIKTSSNKRINPHFSDREFKLILKNRAGIQKQGPGCGEF